MNHQQTTGKYKIGAVATMTGIPPETLRMWERRYALVQPLRGNTRVRLYSDRDVQHLGLLKQLVGKGHAISSLAELSIEELDQRLNTHRKIEHADISEEAQPVVSICVLGSVLVGQLRALKDNSSRLRLVGLYSSLFEFEQGINEARPDILVLEYQTLMSDDLKEIRNRFRLSHAKHLIVVYTFTNSLTLRKLASASIQAVQGPLNVEAFAQLCENTRLALPGKSNVNIGGDAVYHPRRFNDEQLAKISTVQTEVGCECPHHVALILSKLTAFETYSQNCEDQNGDDAALHAHLRRITMQARASFEAALPDILAADGIDLDTL